MCKAPEQTLRRAEPSQTRPACSPMSISTAFCSRRGPAMPSPTPALADAEPSLSASRGGLPAGAPREDLGDRDLEGRGHRVPMSEADFLLCAKRV